MCKKTKQDAPEENTKRIQETRSDPEKIDNFIAFSWLDGFASLNVSSLLVE
jgi:hypothetical protein